MKFYCNTVLSCDAGITLDADVNSDYWMVHLVTL